MCSEGVWSEQGAEAGVMVAGGREGRRLDHWPGMFSPGAEQRQGDLCEFKASMGWLYSEIQSQQKKEEEERKGGERKRGHGRD